METEQKLSAKENDQKRPAKAIDDARVFQPGDIVLPGFDSPLPPPDAGIDRTVRLGRVLGLDYDKWAVAILDVSDVDERPQRVASQRLRITSKGYKRLGGNPLVGGYEHVEVYILPRQDYERRRDYRRERIENAVAYGVMQDSALAKAVTTTSQRANRRAG